VGGSTIGISFRIVAGGAGQWAIAALALLLTGCFGGVPKSSVAEETRLIEYQDILLTVPSAWRDGQKGGVLHLWRGDPSTTREMITFTPIGSTVDAATASTTDLLAAARTEIGKTIPASHSCLFRNTRTGFPMVYVLESHAKDTRKLTFCNGVIFVGKSAYSFDAVFKWDPDAVLGIGYERPDTREQFGIIDSICLIAHGKGR
jgi:hypothetical protein